jgi:hypothetical protein
MKKTLSVALALMLAAPLAAQTSTAAPQGQPAGISQADIDLLRRDVAAARKELVAQSLTLTPEEATRFWPVYDQYSAEMNKVLAERAAVITDFANSWGKVDNKTADSLARRSLDVDVRTAELRRSWFPRFEKVLDSVKAASFVQIDRRIALLIDMQLAASIPLMQAQPAK